MGYEDGAWESLRKMLNHYTFYAGLVVAPLLVMHIFFGGPDYLYGCIVYFAVQTAQAVFHWYIASRRIGTPVAYLTEFFAGVARIGALPLLIIL
jgi:hypothetical protein